MAVRAPRGCGAGAARQSPRTLDRGENLAHARDKGLMPSPCAPRHGEEVTFNRLFGLFKNFLVPRRGHIGQ